MAISKAWRCAGQAGIFENRRRCFLCCWPFSPGPALLLVANNFQCGQWEQGASGRVGLQRCWRAASSDVTVSTEQSRAASDGTAEEVFFVRTTIGLSISSGMWLLQLGVQWMETTEMVFVATNRSLWLARPTTSPLFSKGARAEVHTRNNIMQQNAPCGEPGRQRGPWADAADSARRATRSRRCYSRAPLERAGDGDGFAQRKSS